MRQETSCQKPMMTGDIIPGQTVYTPIRLLLKEQADWVFNIFSVQTPFLDILYVKICLQVSVVAESFQSVPVIS